MVSRLCAVVALLTVLPAAAQDDTSLVGWSGTLVHESTRSSSTSGSDTSSPPFSSGGSASRTRSERTVYTVTPDGAVRVRHTYDGMDQAHEWTQGTVACTPEEWMNDDPRFLRSDSWSEEREEQSGEGAGTCELWREGTDVTLSCSTEATTTFRVSTSSRAACTNCCDGERGATGTSEGAPDGSTGTFEILPISVSMENVTDPDTLAGSHVSYTIDGQPGFMATRWFLSRRGDYVLRVEVAGYDTWRPTAGESEAVTGNTVTVKATLARRDGRPLDQRARRIRFELVQRSREPGVTLNWPPPAAQLPGAPDLRFEHGPNTALLVEGEEGERAVTPDGQHTEASAVVSAFDWGAYGALNVVAELEDGRRVLGELMGSPGTHDVLLPKRASADDPIAAGWRAAQGVGDLDGRWDADALPAGDGHTGDGLTLYEEYRGVHVGGGRRELSHRRKDHFVRNELGATAAPGIALWEAISDLDVHAELTAEELGPDRVVNRNTSGRFRRVAQHGVVLRQGYDTSRSVAWGNGPGTPRLTEVIFVSSATTNVGGALEADLAHELGHTANLRHHGDSDLRVRRWVDVGGVIWEGDDEAPDDSISDKAQVRVFSEAGTPLTPAQVSLPRNVYVSTRGGEHSGDDVCVMRYHVADAHVRTEADARYVNAPPSELRGVALCSQARGTGVNAPSHSPAPRSADATRGACIHQLCVNDAHSHP